MLDGSGTATQRGGMNIQSLNGTLRIQHGLEHNQTFPSEEELLPHLHAEILQHKVEVQASLEDTEVALGWRTEFL